jgi:hypothetical protein
MREIYCISPRWVTSRETGNCKHVTPAKQVCGGVGDDRPVRLCSAEVQRNLPDRGLRDVSVTRSHPIVSAIDLGLLFGVLSGVRSTHFWQLLPKNASWVCRNVPVERTLI